MNTQRLPSISTGSASLPSIWSRTPRSGTPSDGGLTNATEGRRAICKRLPDCGGDLKILYHNEAIYQRSLWYEAVHS
jgi:hypothetical protein